MCVVQTGLGDAPQAKEKQVPGWSRCEPGISTDSMGEENQIKRTTSPVFGSNQIHSSENSHWQEDNSIFLVPSDLLSLFCKY